MAERKLGRVQGKSAYEVALDTGFIGTEAEWLESIKGAQGEQGVQGNSYTQDDNLTYITLNGFTLTVREV